jgi:hypothetical protein
LAHRSSGVVLPGRATGIAGRVVGGAVAGVVAGTVDRGFAVVVTGRGLTVVDVEVEVEVEVELVVDDVVLEVVGAGTVIWVAAPEAEASGTVKARVAPATASTANTAATQYSVRRADAEKAMPTCRPVAGGP